VFDFLFGQEAFFTRKIVNDSVFPVPLSAQDTVGVKIIKAYYFNLRHASWCWGDTSQFKLCE